MPTILELKEIDGAIWARLDLVDATSPVTLYTNAEMTAHDNEMIEECALKLEQLADAAEASQSRATTREQRERYSERSVAMLDGAVSIRNLKD